MELDHLAPNVKVLSDQIGVARMTVGRYLRGTSVPNEQIADAIEQITGLPAQLWRRAPFANEVERWAAWQMKPKTDEIRDRLLARGLWATPRAALVAYHRTHPLPDRTNDTLMQRANRVLGLPLGDE